VVRQAAATGRAAIAWELARAVAHYCDLRDRFELWRQTHQRAWTACRLAGDVRGQAAILLGLADLAGAVGDASAELSYGNHAAQLFEVLGEPARRAYALVHCGEACRKKGRYRESTDYAWLALMAIGALPGNQASEASAYASIGRVRRDQGAFASAAEFLCRAEEIWRELGHHGRVTAVVAELDSLATGETERAAV
jgi:tetratricopeptide (TPR) repeat protein